MGVIPLHTLSLPGDAAVVKPRPWASPRSCTRWRGVSAAPSRA